jgi:hypothetical protein
MTPAEYLGRHTVPLDLGRRTSKAEQTAKQ